ncbi:hypothetical protein L218DRAFT_1017766 [Marasmius fiardii PR-910]|nr:hypothetical protein L218DRAFT_1017766 [Marasmius fiardii PR-910]
MHESLNIGGSLRLWFNVYGSTAVNLGISPPGYNITCSLDGNALGDGGFLVEEHELIINVTTWTNTHVYLDYIVYEVSPDAPINGDVLRIGVNQNGTLPALQDQHLIFNGRWFSNDSTGAATAYIPGSSEASEQYTISIYPGTQIQLYGEIINASSPTTAQYQLDGGPQHDFSLTPSTTSKTNKLLLNVPSLTPTEHTLTVTLGGGSDDMALFLSYFLVTSTTSSSSPNPTSLLPSPIPAQYTSSKAAIIGGVVGGIVGLITILILVILWLKKHRKNEPVSDEWIDPFFIAPMGERGFDPQSLISHTRHENGRRAKSHLTQGQPTSEEAETAAGLSRCTEVDRQELPPAIFRKMPLGGNVADTQAPVQGMTTVQQSWETIQKKGYKEDIDTSLVFWLQEDPSDTTVALLTELVQQGRREPPSSPEKFIASSSVVRINTFWFLSLALALVDELFGLLCKQWRSPQSWLMFKLISSMYHLPWCRWFLHLSITMFNQNWKGEWNDITSLDHTVDRDILDLSEWGELDLNIVQRFSRIEGCPDFTRNTHSTQYPQHLQHLQHLQHPQSTKSLRDSAVDMEGSQGSEHWGASEENEDKESQGPSPLPVVNKCENTGRNGADKELLDGSTPPTTAFEANQNVRGRDIVETFKILAEQEGAEEIKIRFRYPPGFGIVTTSRDIETKDATVQRHPKFYVFPAAPDGIPGQMHTQVLHTSYAGFPFYLADLIGTSTLQSGGEDCKLMANEDEVPDIAAD